MTHSFQVTIDCADPHVLADWWAETLDWVVEPQDEAFIRSMIEQGHATESDAIQHRGKLVWRTGAAIGSGGEPSPDRVRMFFQTVPEPKTVKNRIHLDVRPSDGTDIEAFRSSLLDRGATQLGSGQQGPHTWVTMADPEGNEFCV